MGHHAQYRKRGSNRPGEDRRQAPPPPSIVQDGGRLVITPTGRDDTGGILRSYAATAEAGPFTAAGDDGWASSVTKILPHLPYGIWVYVTEIGNGTAYGGESDPSNTVYIQPLG